MTNPENSHRIARNTVVLYVRMLLIMILSLYISRVVLNALGSEDYGIYNVVAGIVILLAFLNNAMTGATQRYLSFEIGTGNIEKVRKIFHNSLIIHIGLVVIIVLLAETVGLWFLKTQLNIPEERLHAAEFVYQFSIITFSLSIIQVPFRASLIAREDMGIYAGISIFEVLLKLIVALLLTRIGYDSLKLYSILLTLVSLLVLLVYIFTTYRKYQEISLKIVAEQKLLKEMTQYAGWSVFGSSASVIYQQGINFLLNIFFNVVVNAARAISLQLTVALNSFITSFQTAVNPQIVKAYASGNREYMFKLIFNSSKFTFFILYIFSLPVLFEIDIILKFWLKTVPEYTSIFAQLAIIDLLINSVSNPLMIAAQATGRIKVYQLVVGGLLLFNLPISWILLANGFPPEVTFIVSIALSVLSLLARMLMLRGLVGLNIPEFIQLVILPIITVSTVSLIIPFTLKWISGSEILLILSCLIFTTLISYYLGLKKQERGQVIGFLKAFIK